MRRYFGTDGVRGVFGADLTVELVEQLGKAATLWSGRGRVFVGRDTRGSGPSSRRRSLAALLPRADNAVLAGVLPTPAVALLALDLGVVITASHNPPEYNGVKFFDSDGQQAHGRLRGGDRGAPRRSAQRGGGSIDRVTVAEDSYLEHVVERFRHRPQSGCGSRSTARTARTRRIAPEAFE